MANGPVMELLGLGVQWLPSRVAPAPFVIAAGATKATRQISTNSLVLDRLALVLDCLGWGIDACAVQLAG